MSTILTYDTTVLSKTILHILSGRTIPMKTKHLASRLHMERPDLVEILNKLREQKKVAYTRIINNASDSRGREDIIYGWVSTP